MYNVNDVVVGGVRLKNLFSNQDEKWHSTYIRPIKNLYSMTKVQDVEGNVDATINLFLDQLRQRFSSTGDLCEMTDWINFCEFPCIGIEVLEITFGKIAVAWDVMSQLTFSQNLGILEAGSDYKGFLGRSARTLDYFAPVCVSWYYRRPNS